MAEPARPERSEEGARGFVSLAALRITLGRPPLWLFAWALELLLAALPAFVYYSWMNGAIQHRYAPDSLFANLDTVFRFDQRRSLGLVDSATGETGAALALAAMLIGCFCAGGWLQVFLERTHGHSLRQFFFGGSRYFWRFFRVLLITVLTLGISSWIVYDRPWQTVVLKWLLHVPKEDFDRLETLASEHSVVWLRFVQHGLFAFLAGLILVWGDYTRTRIALHDTFSAVWAGLCTWFTLLRHPVRTLRPLIGLFGLEVLIALGAGIFAHMVEGEIGARAELSSVLILFLVGQLVLVWRSVLRGARYHAAVAVSREVVRPIARPDPWKASLGPRYPVGGDEFGMSL